MKQLGRYDVVVIDDIGYVQQNREEMEVLFTLLADRYERGGVMLTSNLPFSKLKRGGCPRVFLVRKKDVSNCISENFLTLQSTR